MKPASLPLPPLEAQAPTWAALRCQSAATLPLASNLQAQGLIAWTPGVIARYRLPRRRKTELRAVPLLPSFVFVPFQLADSAMELGQRGTVPRNWPFLFNGDRPALPVDQLLAMQMGKPGRNDEQFTPGEAVRIIAGPMAGLGGVVLNRKGRDRWLLDISGARVLVPGFLIVSLKLKA
jgi:transcription antitermination factor NusG